MRTVLLCGPFILLLCASAQAVANPKIDKHAVSPYTQKGYPKLYQQWGEKGIKEINAMLPLAAQKAAASPECDKVEIVELSGNRSVPGKNAVFFADCKNGKRFYISQSDLKSDKPARSKQSKTAGLKESEATIACENSVKARLTNPGTFQRKMLTTSFYRAPTGNVAVEFAFVAKSDFGAELPSKARCIFTDLGLESTEITKS